MVENQTELKQTGQPEPPLTALILQPDSTFQRSYNISQKHYQLVTTTLGPVGDISQLNHNLE